jgi:hypothetical protein
MANYEICGAVKSIMEPRTFPSGFVKREFVVMTEEDYPQTILFECIKQQCGLLDRIAVNDRVRVSFRLRGREYKERFFVNLEAVGVEKMGVDGSSVAMDEAPPPVSDDDPMPF